MLKINKDELSVVDITVIRPEARLEKVCVDRKEAVGIHANNLMVEDSQFIKMTLIQAQLGKCQFTDVSLAGCDFSATQLDEMSCTRTESYDCRLTGVDFNQSTFKDVVFKNCKLDLANFRFAKLQNVQFIDCSMTEVDFQGALIQKVRFENCHMEKVEFAQCKVEGVDATGSQLINIYGWQFLKGIKIDSMQLIEVAPQLARELGIRVV